MRYLFFLALILTSSPSALAQKIELEAFLKTEMKDRKIPGMEVTVVQHGKIVFDQHYGIANLQDEVPVTDQTIFAINSCTKAFTGVAVMQLVEDGKLDLSLPVSNYLDGLPEAWRPITIMQLLTHISGLPDIANLTNKMTGGENGMSKEDVAYNQVIKLPMDGPTGTHYRYNQTNYLLLGKIITKLSGEHFTKVFADRQFKIAGMQHTMFGDARDVMPHFAPTYTFRKNIDNDTPDKDVLVNFPAEFPLGLRAGSGLNSTGRDLAKWILALQQQKLLRTKEALNTLWTPGKFNDGTNTPVALGWGLAYMRPDHRAVGMSGGGRSAFLVYPDDDMAVIVLTNLSGSFPETFIDEIAGYFNAAIPLSDPITAIRVHMKKNPDETAIDAYNVLKKINPNLMPAEWEVNDWGYRLIAIGNFIRAVDVLKLNTILYPSSWNTYDSYGEALAKSGNKTEAIKMYQKSIELNPNNNGGKQAIEKLQK